MGWLCHYPGIVWKPIQKWALTQLDREHSATVVSACWATVDWSWHKERNKCTRANLHIKTNQKSAGKEWLVKHSPQYPCKRGKSQHHNVIQYNAWNALQGCYFNRHCEESILARTDVAVLRGSKDVVQALNEDDLQDGGVWMVVYRQLVRKIAITEPFTSVHKWKQVKPYSIFVVFMSTSQS